MTDQLKRLAKEINWPLGKVTKTVELLDEGNTIPFIARYRKEVTGEMDEVVLRQLAERLQYLRNLEQRKTDVLHSIDAVSYTHLSTAILAVSCWAIFLFPIHRCTMEQLL